MKLKKILSVTAFLIAMSLNGLQATETQGQVKITAIINGKSVPAVVKINKSKDRVYAYWTMYQPGGPVLTTPLSVSLPAGKYFLHVKPWGIHSPIKEQAIPFMLSTNEKVVKRIDFPVGHLKITSSEEESGKPIDTLINIKQGWRNIVPANRETLHSPADIIISPGQYQVNATNVKDQQRQKKTATVISGKTTELNLQFKQSHFGYLAIAVEMNGGKLSQQEYSRYGKIILLNSKTQKKIQQINGGYGEPYQLRSGLYDIKFQTSITGEKDILIKNVEIADNKKIMKSIYLQQPGEIQLSALWTNKPKDLRKCINSLNPFDSRRLGTLMGGPGGTSGGKCFDNRINGLISELVSVNGEDINISRKNNFFVKLGLYKIKVWPYDHRDLSKTIDAVDIKPGTQKKVALKFPWPFVQKKLKIKNRYISTIQRKTPLGEGVIHVAATINGQPTTNRAQFSVFKLDSRGQESTGLFYFYTKNFGDPIGLKLPLQKSIPVGFYNAYIEPFGPHLVVQKKRFDFYMDAKSNINKTVDFKTGRLKIKSINGNALPDNLRVFITRDDNTSVLHRFHQNKLPLDIQITPNNYTVKLYTKNNSVYFSKKISIKENEQVVILVP